MRFRSMVVLCLAATALACSDIPSDTDDGAGACGEYGTFTALVSGAMATQLSGCSVYATVPSATGATFVLLLFRGTPPSPPDLFEITGPAVRPEPGIHAVSLEGPFHATYMHREPGIARTFVVTRGSLSITLSSAAGVNGSVVFAGEDAGQTVQVIGSFRARCAALAEGHVC